VALPGWANSATRAASRAAALGDRRWHRLLEGHQQAVRRQLVRFRGREVKTTGDGFLATFDGPARAIRAADAIRAELAELGLEVRVGLHTGEWELLGEDIGGIAVHIAARVLARAGAGEIWCSRTVKDLVAGGQVCVYRPWHPPAEGRARSVAAVRGGAGGALAGPPAVRVPVLAVRGAGGCAAPGIDG
jgi:class 3 adenylate cyclase